MTLVASIPIHVKFYIDKNQTVGFLERPKLSFFFNCPYNRLHLKLEYKIIDKHLN
jgi:hypothetical protein